MLLKEYLKTMSVYYYYYYYYYHHFFAEDFNNTYSQPELIHRSHDWWNLVKTSANDKMGSVDLEHY